jgi:type VI protein secretion system component VasF
MSAPATLEELCRPVLACFCAYWQLNQAGNPPALEQFRGDIEAALGDARLRAASDPVLRRDYEQIERPLVFFIDFMVKEGNFPFNREWRELARNYNELSGDEKFFNLLSDALKDSRAPAVIPLFFTLLGLGFEGARRQDRRFIETTMKECAARFSGEFDIREEPIVQVDREQRLAGLAKSRGLRSLRTALALSILAAAVSLIVNAAVFVDAVRPFRESLSAAAAQARELNALPPEAP